MIDMEQVDDECIKNLMDKGLTEDQADAIICAIKRQVFPAGYEEE